MPAHRRARRVAHSRWRTRADALQHRRAGHGRNRHGARRDVRRRRAGKARRGLRRRDASAAAGKPTDGVGARARGNSGDGARRRRGGVADARRRNRSVHRRRGSHRRERRCREQDRNAIRSRSRRSITAFRSTSPRPTSTFDPATAAARDIVIEQRDADEVRSRLRRANGTDRRRRLQSGVRRDAGGADHGDHQRSRRRASAIRLCSQPSA